jgi:hypothetical protein
MNVSPPSMITMMGYHCHSVDMQRAPQKQKFALQGHSSNPKKISSYVTLTASYLDSVITLKYSHNTQSLGNFSKQIPT